MNKAMLSLLTVAAATAAAAMPAQAQGWFVEGRVTGASLEGSSETRNGGAAFGGGGIVENVQVEADTGFGLTVGRQVTDRWSVGVSYDDANAEVSYTARFLALSPSLISRFRGDLSAETALLIVRYAAPLSERWSLEAEGGIGASQNELTGIFETFSGGGGLPLRDGSQTRLAFRAGATASYALSERVSVYGQARFDSFGEFKTGNARDLSEAITPYRLDVEGVSASVGLRYAF